MAGQKKNQSKDKAAPAAASVAASSSAKSIPYIRASDAQLWTQCVRLPWYKYNLPAAQDASLPKAPDLRGDFMAVKGRAHKKKILRYLSGIFNVSAAAHSAQQTQDLMKQGADLIYKPELVDHQLRVIGHPDFLKKEDDGEYRAMTAKLSRSTSSLAVQIQLGLYRRLLPPGYPVHVYLDKNRQDFVGPEADDVVDEFLTSMRDALGKEHVPDAPYVHGKCKSCRYRDLCLPGFEQKDDPTLLPGLDRQMAAKLKEAGYDTISKLAQTRPQDLPVEGGLKNYAHRENIITHAKVFKTGRPHQTGKANLPKGTWVHFDVEGNPTLSGGKEHVYLWGLLGPGHEKKDYEYIWAKKPQNDKDCFVKFLNKIDEYRQKYPDMILAHYSPAEVNTIQSYAARYQMEQHPTVRYLLGANSPFFDLEPVVKNNFILPVRGYGLKDICKHPNLVNFQWEDESASGEGSIALHNLYLNAASGADKKKAQDNILAYNRDDTIATRRLELWLRERDREFDRKIPLTPKPPGP